MNPFVHGFERACRSEKMRHCYLLVLSAFDAVELVELDVHHFDDSLKIKTTYIDLKDSKNILVDNQN